MSKRMTSVGPRYGRLAVPEDLPWPSGVERHGRKTRAEMLAAFRAHYGRQKAEAELALNLSDDELIVETYLGTYVMRDCQEVTE